MEFALPVSYSKLSVWVFQNNSKHRIWKTIDISMTADFYYKNNGKQWALGQGVTNFMKNPQTQYRIQPLPTSALRKRRAHDLSSQFCVWYPNTLSTLFSGYCLDSTDRHTHIGNDRDHPEKFILHKSSHKLEWILGTKSYQEIKYYFIGWNMRGRGRGRCLRKYGFWEKTHWHLGLKGNWGWGGVGWGRDT